MAVSIVRWYFQGPGKKSKKGNLSVLNKKLQKNEKKIERMYAVWGTAFRVHVRDVCIYLKRKSQLVGPKSEEKQDKDDYTCQGLLVEIFSVLKSSLVQFFTTKRGNWQPQPV